MKKFILRCAGAVFGIFVLLLIVAAFIPSQPKTTGTYKSSDQSEAPKADLNPHDAAMQSTKIAKFSWSTDGMVMTANFTIKNSGDAPVKDFKIKCEHSAPSGTVIDSNTRTIYEIVPAHKIRTFRNFNMGFIDSQATASSCKIEDLALVR